MATNTPLTSLPFVTAPEVETVLLGNKRCGVLEFPVYNDLTVNESAWLQSSGTGKTAFQFTSKLALKIARAEKVKPVDSHGFVAKMLAGAMGMGGLELSDKEQNWAVKYCIELEDVGMQVLEISTQATNLLVTCLIRHRLKGMEEWSPAQTANLPSELVEEIYMFALKEQNRGVSTTPEEVTEELEEALGKQKRELQEKMKESTGEASTTSSESSTQETPTSEEKPSDI